MHSSAWQSATMHGMDTVMGMSSIECLARFLQETCRGGITQVCKCSLASIENIHP